MLNSVEEKLLSAGEGLPEVAMSAGILKDKNKTATRHHLWIALTALGLALAGVFLYFFQASAFDIRVSEVRAEQAGQLVLLLQKQRGLVAGAQDPLPTRVDITLPDNAQVLGDPNAKVQIVEFSDFQCAYCKKFFNETLGKIKSEYIDTGKANFVYQNFAFLGEESVRAAEGALCAGEQGKFWEYHDVVFSEPAGTQKTSLTDAKIKSLAKKAGLSSAEFSQCFDDGKYAKQVEEEQVRGREYGVSGTPTVFINGYRHVGALPYETFKSAIEAELAK